MGEARLCGNESEAYGVVAWLAEEQSSAQSSPSAYPEEENYKEKANSARSQQSGGSDGSIPGVLSLCPASENCCRRTIPLLA